MSSSEAKAGLWRSLLPLHFSQERWQRLFGPPPWKINPTTLRARTLLACALFLTVAAGSAAFGSWVSEDNDMLVYLGTLVIVSLHFGRFASTLCCALSLTLLSVGRVHSGFALDPTQLQFVMSFTVFIMVTWVISSLSDRNSRDQWLLAQNNHGTEVLREFSETLSLCQTRSDLLSTYHEFLHSKLALRCELDQSEETPRVYWPCHLSAQERLFLEAFLEELHLCYKRTLTILQGRDLQSQQTILQTTQRQQSALMASLTHDLQTPLASILGSLETLKNTNLDLNRQQSRELAEIAYVQSHRLLDLTKNLLHLSKIEANGISLRGQPIYLNEIMETILTRLDVQHQQRIDLHCHQPVKACWGDPTLIMQALVNPLDNALKFSHGKVRVEIFPASEQDSSTCRICDQGPGIVLEEQEQIFQRFYRSPSVSSIPGSGLGLFITKALMELHQGSITVLSRIGQGTTIVLKWPVHRELEAN